jgi:hypothetical protein
MKRCTLKLKKQKSREKVMKQYLFIMSVALFSSLAAAKIGDKEPLKVDFRSLIDNTSAEKTELASGVNDSITQKKSQNKSATDRVSDFVDVEIGWGKAPAVVDRRFDSTGEPVIILKTN